MNKLDKIWDLAVKLAEDDDSTGKLDYRKGHDGTVRLTVTLNGKRVTVYIEREGEP